MRESDAHKRIKSLIEHSLHADPQFIPESIKSEKRWKADNSDRWRQPDVQANSLVNRFAFEAQLTTTFLDVVVNRRLFYKKEGAMLVWILRSFDPEYRLMTMDDILFCNNRNIFVVDDETTQASEKESKFFLRCHYRKPYLDGKGINECWQTAIVSFADLDIDIDRQRIYYYDYESEFSRMQQAVSETQRKEFIVLWRDCCLDVPLTSQNGIRWSTIRRSFADRGAVLPDEPSSDASFRNLINGVLSALDGSPFGWQYGKLIEVAHLIANSHPENLLPFGYALEHANHKCLLEKQDISGKWAKRKQEFQVHIRNLDPMYMPKSEWLPALSLIFPEVGTSVQLEKHD